LAAVLVLLTIGTETGAQPRTGIFFIGIWALLLFSLGLIWIWLMPLALGLVRLAINMSCYILTERPDYAVHARRCRHAGELTSDCVGGGFPAYQELLAATDDALEADRHLNQMPSVETLKDQVVHTIDGATAWWVKVVVSGHGRVLNYK